MCDRARSNTENSLLDCVPSEGSMQVGLGVTIWFQLADELACSKMS